MTYPIIQTVETAYRLIPSIYPTIGLFDTVSSAADARAVMDLVGWTNDRLVEHRLNRLPESEWVYGFPNSTVIMAAFLHCGPEGMRFNNSELGAWYAATDVTAAIVEVAHHLRREAKSSKLKSSTRVYRTYSCALSGNYIDLRGSTYLNILDSKTHEHSQAFGEGIRNTGGDGIIYDSVRFAGGTNIVAFKPKNIANVIQTDHYKISVSAAGNDIDVTKLSA